jgi:hypothetical protein
MAPRFLSFRLVDECGEGEYQECVITEGGAPDAALLLYVHFDQPAQVGSRFTYSGLTWELTEEVMAKPGTIEGGDTFWVARPAEQ